MTYDIKKATMEEFLQVIPAKEIEQVFIKNYGKREYALFCKFLQGQTMQLLEQQTGIYFGDLMRYLDGRKKGVKKFSLHD